MTAAEEEHKKIHLSLYNACADLFLDYMINCKKSNGLNSTIRDVEKWAYKMSNNPDHKPLKLKIYKTGESQ